MGISAGEDLFLVVLHGDGTIRLDSRVICLGGIPNMVFMLKKLRKPSGIKTKEHSPKGAHS